MRASASKDLFDNYGPRTPRGVVPRATGIEGDPATGRARGSSRHRIRALPQPAAELERLGGRQRGDEAGSGADLYHDARADEHAKSRPQPVCQ